MSQEGSTFSRVCEWAACTYSVQLQTNVSIPQPVWVRSHDTLHLSGTSCHTSSFSHSDQGENCNSCQEFKQINPDRIFGERFCSMFTLAICNIFMKYSALYVRCYMNYHYRWSVLFKTEVLNINTKYNVQYRIYNIQKQQSVLSTKIKAFFTYKMRWTSCFMLRATDNILNSGRLLPSCGHSATSHSCSTWGGRWIERPSAGLVNTFTHSVDGKWVYAFLEDARNT